MMDEPDVEVFRVAASEWLRANREFAPRDYGAICPPDLIDAGIAWQRRLFEAGYAGIHWPTDFGGRGLTTGHQAAWIEASALAGVPPFLNMVGLVLAGQSIIQFGTPAQQHQHLRPTLLADQVWCQLFSEPGAGSDLGSLSTRAELDGDRYIIDGQKVWCSGGRCSDWGILMARTDPAAKKHAGISFFLFPMHLPGVEVRPLRQMTREAEFDEVFFTDVELPAEHLLGPRHGGWGVGMAVLTNGRLDGRVADEARHHRDDVRCVDAARRSDGSPGDARRTGLVRNARRSGRPHRRRHEPDPAQHHRRAPARSAAVAGHSGKMDDNVRRRHEFR